MKRRKFLAGGIGTLSVLFLGRSLLPVIPRRPVSDAEDALGWISHRDGRYTLVLPRAEMGQNIATGLKQVACTELGVGWDAVEVVLQDTGRMARVKGTVGSDSAKDYAEPLAQACATLRDALAAGTTTGELKVVSRPVEQLRLWQGGGLVGTTPPIEQGREIVTGAPLFASDVRLPGMLYGRVVRSRTMAEIAAKPKIWNSAAAKAVPGFVAIVDDPALALGRNRGLGIVATTPSALDRVAAALDVQWDVSADAQMDVAKALDIDARLKGGNLRKAVAKDDLGSFDGWAVDLAVQIPLAAHSSIEPRAAVARLLNDGMEIWAGSQDPFYVRDVVGRYLDMSIERVRVHGCRIGGGFGGKTICTVELEAALLARKVGKPVKVQWNRAQELGFAFHRPPVSHRIRVGVDRGKITHWRHDLVSSHILFTSAVLPATMQSMITQFAGDGGVARGAKPPYRTGLTRVDYDLVRMPVHTGPWRGLGAGPNILAIESAVDEAARAAGQDPLAFRLAMIDDPRLAGVLQRVAEMAAWSERPASVPPGGVRFGRGIAAGIYKDMSYAAAVADVVVDADGTVAVTRMWCAHDCGRVINPDQVRAQCEGNLAWGIGMVLTDGLRIDGKCIAAETFADAPIPTMRQVPDIEIALVQSDAKPTGAGETAIVAGPGAIANAIRAATGVRPTRFPVEARSLRQS